MNRWSRIAAAVLAVGVGTTPRGDASDPPGDRPIDLVRRSYANLEQYQATLWFTLEEEDAPWRLSKTGDYHIAFDRPTGRIKVDTPDYYLVVDGPKLRMRTEMIPGRHLEVDVPSPATYQDLVQAMQYIDDPIMLDLVLLTANDPVEALSRGVARAAVVMEPDEADPQRRLRLGLDTEEGRLILSLDRPSNLVHGARLEVKPIQLDGQAELGGRYLYDYRAVKMNEPIGDEVFAFDTTNSTATGSIDQLLASGAAPVLMPERDAPDVAFDTIDGKKFRLGEVEERVVVATFWATTFDSCGPELQRLQNVREWADEADKPVAIYTVSLFAPAEATRAFLDRYEVDLPVLLDPEGASEGAFEFRGVPETVVISGGKIVAVAQGPDEQLESSLRGVIDNALGARQ